MQSLKEHASFDSTMASFLTGQNPGWFCSSKERQVYKKAMTYHGYQNWPQHWCWTWWRWGQQKTRTTYHPVQNLRMAKYLSMKMPIKRQLLWSKPCRTYCTLHIATGIDRELSLFEQGHVSSLCKEGPSPVGLPTGRSYKAIYTFLTNPKAHNEKHFGERPRKKMSAVGRV